MIAKARLRTVLYDLKSSLWFVPTCMVVASIFLAFVMVLIDSRLHGDSLSSLGWVYTGGPDGATAVLSSISSSMVTVAGVVFSITIVAMTLASTQFGPRLLQNFMRDRVNQVVLGTFISTFIYSLLVLRTIRRAEEFVPQLSVTMGILLAIVSLFVLIYFIHHVSSSIQADAVIFKVERELNAMIDLTFEEEAGREPHGGQPQESEEEADGEEERAWPVEAPESGYVQAVDEEGVIGLAQRHDLVLRLKYRPGDFALQGGTLALVQGKPDADEEERRRIASKLNELHVIGPQRTPVQDLEFSVNQIVEIAIRALSPGINDTFTALNCLDRLGSALSKLVGREPPSPFRYDRSGKLRVIARSFSFEGAAKAAFDLIRQNADVAVVIRLLEVVRRIAHRAVRKDDLDTLLKHAEMARGRGERIASEESDRLDILSRYAQTVSMIERRRKGEPDRDDG